MPTLCIRNKKIDKNYCFSIHINATMPQLRFIDIIISVNTDNNFFSIFNIYFLVDGICGIDKISVVYKNSIGFSVVYCGCH